MTTPTRRATWPLIVLTTLTLVIGCSEQPHPTDPPPAAAAELSAPLPTVPQDYHVLAATADQIWVEFSSGDRRRSTDGGASWQQAQLTYELGPAIGGNGWFSYYGGDDGMASPRAYDPAGNPVGGGGWWGEDFTLAALGPRAALATNGRLITASRSRKVTFPALPTSAGPVKHSYAFTSDSATLVRISTTTEAHDYASVIDVATGKPSGPLALPRTGQHRVSGSALYSLTGTVSGLQLCRQPLPSGVAGCQAVGTGDQRQSKATLYQAGAISLIRDPGSATPLLIEDGRVVPVELPAGTASWRSEGPGDPTRPLIRTVDGNGDPHHLRIGADGRTTEYLPVPRVPVELSAVALTPTTLLGSYRGGLSDGPAWTRSLDAQALGAPQPVEGMRSVDGASGSRWLLRDNQYRVHSYDQGRRRARFPANSYALSGPYLMDGDGQVRLVTGTKLTTRRADAIFGSLVAERITSKGTALTVRDLDGTGKPVTVTLHKTEQPFRQPYLWGDWIGGTFDSDSGHQAVVVDYRTGRRLTHQGELMALADGFALLSDDDYRLSTWNLAADAVAPLGAKRDSPVAISGSRVAYSTETDLVVRTVDDTARSAPRLLGVLTHGEASAASPWTIELDLTKPVRAGLLVIRAESGPVVRTLITPAAPDGSLRGLSWDGTNDAGAHLAPDRYRWELTVPASDGSGNATSITGTTPPGGAVTIG